MNAQRNFELPNVSFPDFWDRMMDDLSVLLKPLSELLEIQAAILEQPVTEQLHQTVRMIIKEMTNSLAGLSLLALNGYGNNALKLARGIYEGGDCCLFGEEPESAG